MNDERRTYPPLSEEQMEELAERAARKAVAKMQAEFYQQVGRSVISRFTVIVGLLAVAVFLWLQHHNPFK